MDCAIPMLCFVGHLHLHGVEAVSTSFHIGLLRLSQTLLHRRLECVLGGLTVIEEHLHGLQGIFIHILANQR